MINLYFGISLITFWASFYLPIREHITKVVHHSYIDIFVLLVILIFLACIFSLFKFWKRKKISKLISLPLFVGNTLGIIYIFIHSYNSAIGPNITTSETFASIESIMGSKPRVSDLVESYLQSFSSITHLVVLVFVIIAIFSVIRTKEV